MIKLENMDKIPHTYTRLIPKFDFMNLIVTILVAIEISKIKKHKD